MGKQRINPADLYIRRLDPGFYAEDFVRTAHLVSACGEVATLESVRKAAVPIRRGIDMPCISKRPTGPVLVTIGAFDPPGINLDGLERLDAHQHDQFRGSHIQPGDLLVAMGGYVGRAAICPEDTPEANIGRHTARVVIDPAKASTHYVFAFISSIHGQRQLQRQVTGSVQAGVNLEDLRKIPFPLPNTEVQSYIGDKVRQAEALRTRAQALERRFLAEVAVEVPRAARPARFTRITPDRIGSDLNPGRYDPDRLSVVDHLTESGQRLGEFATVSTTIAEPHSPSQAYLGLDGISSNSVDLSFSTVEKAGIAGLSRRLEAGAAISKLRPYLNKVALVPADLAGALGSTELLCVRAKGVHAGFVYGVLKLDTTMRQLNPVATGATHPRVSSHDVLDVVVPMHDDHEKLGRSLVTAQRAYSAASRLSQAASLLVEALIERKISEADLVAAHRSPEADRALLERLTADGIDAPDADPLFPDMDRLQELIAEAQAKEVE